MRRVSNRLRQLSNFLQQRVFGFRGHGNDTYGDEGTERCKSRFDLLRSGAMIQAEQAVNRFPLPTQGSSQVRAGKSGLPKRPIEVHLQCGKKRQPYPSSRLEVRSRNILAVVDHAGQRGFDSVDRVCPGSRFCLSEGRDYWELGTGDEKRPIVVRCKVDPVGKHHFRPNCFLMALTSPVPSSLPPPCMGNSDL